MTVFTFYILLLIHCDTVFILTIDIDYILLKYNGIIYYILERLAAELRGKGQSHQHTPSLASAALQSSLTRLHKCCGRAVNQKNNHVLLKFRAQTA